MENAPLNQRTSVLAGLGFLCGFSAAIMTAIGTVVYLCADFGDIISATSREREALLVGSKILLYCTLLPGVGALAFWLGARGVVRESQGALRGKGLYRAGIILAVLSMLVAFAGKSSLNGKIDHKIGKTSPPAAETSVDHSDH